MALKDKVNVFALGDRSDSLRMQDQSVILVHVAEDKEQVCKYFKILEENSSLNTLSLEISIRAVVPQLQFDLD